jgi:hypothetical protein
MQVRHASLDTKKKQRDRPRAQEANAREELGPGSLKFFAISL